jgi:hypothetical protein
MQFPAAREATMTRTVPGFIADLNPEEQLVAERMLAKVNVSGPAVDNAITALVSPSSLSSLSVQEKAIVLKMMAYNRDRFAPKLDFERHCQILALHRIGITREALAKMYGVNRRTITHIYNPQSAHYKKVREEEKRLGPIEFRRMYLSQDVMDRALSYRQIAETKLDKNNPHANRKAGAHQVKGPNCQHEHRVVIAWKEAGDQMNDNGIDRIDVAGWYYNDLDSDLPDHWLHVGGDSRSTSDACYRAMLKDIVDRKTS